MRFRSLRSDWTLVAAIALYAIGTVRKADAALYTGALVNALVVVWLLWLLRLTRAGRP
jgi:hypothetical protein